MLQANLHFLFFEGKVHLLDPPIGIQAQQHAVVLRQFAHAAKVATLDYRLKRPLKSTKNQNLWSTGNGDSTLVSADEKAQRGDRWKGPGQRFAIAWQRCS